MCGDFEWARTRALQRMDTREGIGRLQEKLLHATLKFWLDADETHHEVTLPCGAVADIFDGEHVTEIQNGNFSAFRVKLMRLLEEYPMTVVYPLPRRKTVCWVHPQTGECSPPRRSTKIGGFHDALPELFYMRSLLGVKGLTVRLQLIDIEEQKLQDGWGNDGKRGAHRLERIPLALGEHLDICTACDLKNCLPSNLPTRFTSKDFEKAMRCRGRRLSAALKLLYECGIITREKQGRGYIYHVSSKPS